MRHTPEPWDSKDFDESQVAILGPGSDGHTENEVVAVVRVGANQPSGAYNVSLIRSAPLLLRMVADLRDGALTTPVLESLNGWKQLLTRADLLLQYATGRNPRRAAAESGQIDLLRREIRREAFQEVAAFIAKEADRARDRGELVLMHRLDRIHNYVVSAA